MRVQLNIQEPYMDKFKQFIATLPQGAIEIDHDNAISFEEAKQKVEKSIAGISQNKGLDLENAFQKVSDYR